MINAAKPAIDDVAEAVRASAAERERLSGAIRDFRRKWFSILGGSLAGTVLLCATLAYGAVWWQGRELERMGVQRDQLATEIAKLQGQAEQLRRGSSGARRP